MEIFLLVSEFIQDLRRQQPVRLCCPMVLDRVTMAVHRQPLVWSTALANIGIDPVAVAAVLGGMVALVLLVEEMMVQVA
jgi:hypothetical protein